MMVILKMYCCIVTMAEPGKFIVNDGFVFRANKLCIQASSIYLLLLYEAHGGA
jgi:hypothetical protein